MENIVTISYYYSKGSTKATEETFNLEEIFQEMQKSLPKVKIAANKKEDKKLVVDTPVNLESTVNKMGETVTQIIHFSGKNKRTFHGIISASIKDGAFTKMMTKDGRMLMINSDNVDCIEVFSEKTI